MGCGFVALIDGKGRMYNWGDNYAGQLSQNDDVHRDDPVLVRQLTENPISQISLGH